MNPRKNSTAIPVIVAASILSVLAGGLALRLHAHSPEAYPAAVPPPTAIEIGDLEVPCWSCRNSQEWSIRSRTDLDLLAPLGDGQSNAGEWIALFSPTSGQRADDASKARERLIEGPGTLGKVLPADDPLLLEAEPWCDQATMRLYPEIFPVRGYDTEVSDLLLQLIFVKSWIARGLQQEDPERALDDYRRAIRLGRLLRQQDVTVIHDLVGIAAIRLGAEAIFNHAIRRTDPDTALVASIVLGELAPQRLLTSARVVKVDIYDYFPETGEKMILPEQRLETLLEMATSDPDRRFRAEAAIDLGFVAHLGNADQSTRARMMLNKLVDSEDEVMSQISAWSLDHPPTEKTLMELRTPS